MTLATAKTPAARRWAYAGIIVGGLASIAGNVASTVLTISEVHLAFRIPWAVLWPVLVYIAIEVITRTDWRKGWKHWGARVVLIGPVSAVAALVSYLHIHHLMRLSGEVGLAQAVGPLAIDGTLFGCTVVLLLTKGSAQTGTDAQAETARWLLTRNAELGHELQAREPKELDTEAFALSDVLPAPASPAAPAAPVPPVTEPLPYTVGGPALPLPGWTDPNRVQGDKPRRARAAAWDQDKALDMLREGRTKAEVSAAVGVDVKTVQRFKGRMINEGKLSKEMAA